MFGKLLAKDLKKNMRWMWILFVSAIAVAGIARGFKELGETVVFFKILGIFFESVFYTLAVNVILQPFLRNFLNFAKSLYSDDSYLTHTLPVKKSQLINSKFVTALIEILLGFVALVVSLLILFASPTMWDVLRALLATIVGGEISLFWMLMLFFVLVLVEFYMFISIIFLSIVIAYRAREWRVLRSFLYSAAIAFAFLAVLAVVMLIVSLIQGVNILTASVFSGKVFVSMMITGIVVYSLAILLCYVFTQRAFGKGVNVD